VTVQLVQETLSHISGRVSLTLHEK
jgi:hypothetical protein